MVQNEFDLEPPGDENGKPGDGPAAQAFPNADINGRLHARRDPQARQTGASKRNAEIGQLQHAAEFRSWPSGAVQRGWTAADVMVRGSRPFRFVNTHLEAFHPLIRAAQAAELIDRPPGRRPGRCRSSCSAISTPTTTRWKAPDKQAYEPLLAAGFLERSTDKPLSCCLGSSQLAEEAGGDVADFDHQVDPM